jgi:hypothetical protein
VTESSGDIEGFIWVRLVSFIIRIHSAQLGFGSLHSDDFRNFELLWVISLIKFTKKVIMGILLGETS